MLEKIDKLIKRVFDVDKQLKRVISEPDLLLDADSIEERKIAPGLTQTLYLFLSFLFIGIVWACFSEIDEVITAKGRLVSLSPTVVIQPFDTSIVRRLNVQVGQVVNKDEILAELDPTFVGSDLKSEKERLESLNAQLSRIEADLSGKRYLPVDTSHNKLQSGISKDRLESYKSKIEILELSISKSRTTQEFLDNALKNLSTKLASSSEIEAMNKRLYEGGFISKREYLESLERKLDIEKEYLTAVNSRSETGAALQSQQQELKIFKREYNQKLLEELVIVKRERDSLSQGLQKTNLRSGLMEIKAPMDAVVLEIANRSVGSIVTEAAPFITLAPLDAKLNVHAYVEPGDINQVRVGDEAKIKLEAYPFQKYGMLKGRILRITRDVVRPDFRGVAADKDYYVAVVDYNLAENAQFLKSMRLLPGMTLSAEILIGKRSVMSYLIYPVVRLKDESLNEKR